MTDWLIDWYVYATDLVHSQHVTNFTSTFFVWREIVILYLRFKLFFHSPVDFPCVFTRLHAVCERMSVCFVFTYLTCSGDVIGRSCMEPASERHRRAVTNNKSTADAESRDGDGCSHGLDQQRRTVYSVDERTIGWIQKIEDGKLPALIALFTY